MPEHRNDPEFIKNLLRKGISITKELKKEE